MRRLLALAIVGLAAGTGCRMCASPYDYCGPVVDNDCANAGAGFAPHADTSGPAYDNVPAPEGKVESPTPATPPVPSPPTPQARRTRSGAKYYGTY